MDKYLKYFYKNQIGGNPILENAKKYYEEYNIFLQSNIPIDLTSAFGSFYINARIANDIHKSFQKFANNRNDTCQINIPQTQFNNSLINIFMSSRKLFDFHLDNFDGENMYRFYLDMGKSLLRNSLYNCIKYKHYDLDSSNHIDRTHNGFKYTHNKNANQYKNKSLKEIKDIIESSPDFSYIQKNIINVFGVYEDIFEEYYFDDVFTEIYTYIKCNKSIDCFNSENYDMTHLYKYNFKPLNSSNQLVNELYDKIKHIYLPISIYTYDSDILYEMNKKLLDLYDPISNPDDYFNNNFVKLSFIILYSLLIIKNKIIDKNCIEAINTTIGTLPYKPQSSFCYRGIFIDKSVYNYDKLSYQVKINSFSREPNGVKEVLEFYHNKKFSLMDKDQREEKLNNQILILYIARNDDNFIPIQFFNPQLDVAEKEKEVVTLPFVKYNCRPIYNYNKTTKAINNNNDLDINIEEIHKDFFMEINDTEFDLQVFYIDSIENLVKF
jgi:hypothetical protein